MSQEPLRRAGRLEYGVAARTMPGEPESGDGFVVKETSQGVLIGVMDGLGHGVDAAAARKAVASVLSEFAHESVISLFRRSHTAAQRTRGVVMSLASFDRTDATMTWAGVGNVEGLLWRAAPDADPPVEHLLLRAGGVGFSLPELRATVLPVLADDILILATDGVRNNFFQPLLQTLAQGPQAIAERILSLNKKDTDDALVLVARFPGAEE